MSILKNFSMDDLRRERARKAATGGVDLVAGINAIAPEIAKLQPGETAKLKVPGFGTEPNANRKFTMQVTAKLNNLKVKGGAWEGRTFDTLSDGEGFLYVQRGEDLSGSKVPVRKRGGGRSKANATATGETTGDGATVVRH